MDSSLANITANIRVHAVTRQGSVIDVIRLVNPNLSSSNAGSVFSKLCDDMNLTCAHLKINSKGQCYQGRVLTFVLLI